MPLSRFRSARISRPDTTITLPPSVAARPRQQLIAAGVDLRCRAGVGPEDIGRLLTEHDAVILAHGARMPLRLPVPGGDLDGVTDATSFLRTGKAALAGGGADIARLRARYGMHVASGCGPNWSPTWQWKSPNGRGHEIDAPDPLLHGHRINADQTRARLGHGCPARY